MGRTCQPLAYFWVPVNPTTFQRHDRIRKRTPLPHLITYCHFGPSCDWPIHTSRTTPSRRTEIDSHDEQDVGGRSGDEEQGIHRCFCTCPFWTVAKSCSYSRYRKRMETALALTAAPPAHNGYATHLLTRLFRHKTRSLRFSQGISQIRHIHVSQLQRRPSRPRCAHFLCPQHNHGRLQIR